MRTSLFRVTVAVLLLVGIGGLSTPARGVAAAPTYQVEDLGTLTGDSASVAIGINQSGDVVGWSVGPTGTRAFLYTDEDGMTALPAPPGRPVTHARAVSGNGTVVGTASTGGSDIGHAVRWQSGTALDLGTLGTGTFSEGRGVNTAGVAVGHSYTNGGSLLGIHAFRHDDAAGLVDLTPTANDAHAEGINDAGQVAGWSEARAFPAHRHHVHGPRRSGGVRRELRFRHQRLRPGCRPPDQCNRVLRTDLPLHGRRRHGDPRRKRGVQPCLRDQLSRRCRWPGTTGPRALTGVSLHGRRWVAGVELADRSDRGMVHPRCGRHQ